MKHRANTESLGRFSSYRKATIRSMTVALLLNERIITTKAKAHVARRMVEKMITLGKKNSLVSRRRAFALLCDHGLVKVLFDQISPAFAKRAGGYTRTIPYRNRRGDNATLVVLELTEKYKAEKPKKEIKQEKAVKEKAGAKKQLAAKKAAKEEIAQEPLKEEREKPEKAEFVEQKGQEIIPVASEEFKQDKTQAPEKPSEAEKETQRPQEKKPKKMFGGFKGLFKKERE